MSDHQLDEEKIFHVARGIESEEVRSTYLAQICAGDQALRDRVDALLKANEQQQALLNSNIGFESTFEFTGVTEAPGEQIGRYKLLQKIGEGGFGVVYLAEQSRPVRRKVALKVIKPGMDTHSVVARFEAERQALALMDHANIAKVLDGGATESGRPYFVMELVKGVPITDFCDENKFTLRQRLQLFTDVCRAIQHAHQKGIIHRDIKPSNVLVTLHDGKPVPKVIDFGVAKAVSQQLTEKTLFTAHGQMIGTPQYMSPEQAEMSGLDVDTRSDIYSLGILLYELLTGVTPLDPEQIRSTAFAELQRLIREDEPLQPSRRYSTLGDQSASIATQRKTDPQKLGTILRGELDWIVMKTLDKDRNRRYETPDALAKDVENYLSGDTVNACPPSTVYRIQKFVRRYKSLLLTSTAITLLLLVSTVVSTTQYFKAVQAQRESEIKRRELEQVRRQEAIDNAFTLAASEHTEQDQRKIANDYIDKIELPEHDRQILRGLLDAHIANLNGNPLKAIEILEDLSPNESSGYDIIIQANLANAHLEAGDYWRYFEFPVVHGSVTPNTPYEKLFVGAALFWLDFELSVKYLDDAVEQTPSPLGFTYRARTKSLWAETLRGTEERKQDCINMMDDAVQDVEIARYLLRSRGARSSGRSIAPVIETVHMTTLMHAYDVYLLFGLKEKAKHAMSLASDVFQKTFSVSDKKLTYLRAWKGFYLLRHAKILEDEGDSDKAKTEREAGIALLESTAVFGNAMITEKIMDLQATDAVEAERLRLKTLLELEGKMDFMSIAYLHAIDPDPVAGRRKTVEMLEAINHELSIREVIEVCRVHILLGDLDSCREFASKHLASKAFQQYPYALEALRFFAGETTAAEYVLQGKGRGAEGFRILMESMLHLANGDRPQAIESLNQQMKHGLFGTPQFIYSRAILKRLDAEKPWPTWWEEKR